MRSMLWRWSLAVLLGSAWGLAMSSKPLAAAGGAHADPSLSRAIQHR